MEVSSRIEHTGRLDQKVIDDLHTLIRTGLNGDVMITRSEPKAHANIRFNRGVIRSIGCSGGMTDTQIIGTYKLDQIMQENSIEVPTSFILPNGLTPADLQGKITHETEIEWEGMDRWTQPITSHNGKGEVLIVDKNGEALLKECEHQAIFTVEMFGNTVASVKKITISKVVK